MKVLPKGTFLFAISGLEAEGTRGCCAITGVEATTNQLKCVHDRYGTLNGSQMAHTLKSCKAGLGTHASEGFL